MVLPWCHIKEHCSYYHGNPDIDPKRHDTTMARVQKKKHIAVPWYFCHFL